MNPKIDVTMARDGMFEARVCGRLIATGYSAQEARWTAENRLGIEGDGATASPGNSALIGLLNRDLPMSLKNIEAARAEYHALRGFALCVLTQANGDLTPEQFRNYIAGQAARVLLEEHHHD